MKIWVDDIRKKPEDYDIHILSVDSFKILLDKIDVKDIEVLDLDHDAGDYYAFGGDYIKILDYLEEKDISIPIRIHSGNPVGIKNMWAIIKKNGWEYVEYIFN